MRDRTNTIGLWALQGLAATAYLMAGSDELSVCPEMLETFEKIGVGQGFRYAVAGIRVGAAILLLIPDLAPLGAAILVCRTTGAVRTNLLWYGGSPLPALILLGFNALVLGVRFGTLQAWLGEAVAPAPKAGNTISRPVARPVNRPSRKLVNVIST